MFGQSIKRPGWIMEDMQMNISRGEITEGFRNAGLHTGDIVLIHSSLKSFGYVIGGVMTVINALFDAVGPEGTVMVPTLTGKYTDSSDDPPVFDVRHTPCWTGKIPETFRQLPEAKRSLHPTHSAAAIGARRDELLDGHETGESPCDKKSPYFKNAKLGGYVMLIGVDQESNTSIHCCEEVAGVPYQLQKDSADIYISGYDGEEILVRNKLHDWHKPPTDFNKFDSLFETHGIMKRIKIGNSTIRMINASNMLELAVDILNRDPFFLLK